MTKRVDLHVHVKIDRKEMENSVKVCMAKTIKNDNAITQRVGLLVYLTPVKTQLSLYNPTLN